MDNPPRAPYKCRGVSALHLARWLALRALRHPASLTLLLACFVAGAVLPQLSPSLAAGHGERGTPEVLAWLARWSFPATLVGALALHAIARSECVFLALAHADDRWRAEWLAATLVALASGAALLGGALLFAFPSGLVSAGLVIGVGLQALHLAALGSILFLLALPPAAGATVFALSVWAGAALAAEKDGGPWLAVLDPASHPMHLVRPDAGLRDAVASVATVVAALAASWMLRAARAPSTEAAR